MVIKSKINLSRRNREKLQAHTKSSTETNTTKKMLASRNACTLNSNSIFRKLETASSRTLADNRSKHGYIDRAITTVKKQDEIYLTKIKSKSSKWMVASYFSYCFSVISSAVLGIASLSAIVVSAPSLSASVISNMANPVADILFIVAIVCVTCAIVMILFYLYSKDKTSLNELNHAEIDFQASIKLQKVVGDILEFCDYIDDSKDKKNRAENFKKNIVDILQNKEIITKMRNLLTIYNRFEKNLSDYINKTDKTFSKNSLDQQQYEFIKEKFSQKAIQQSKHLQESSHKLFGLIFSNLAKNLDSEDVIAIEQLKNVYIKQKLHNIEQIRSRFASVGLGESKFTPPNISNNFKKIQQNIENIIATAIATGANDSFKNNKASDI